MQRKKKKPQLTEAARTLMLAQVSGVGVREAEAALAKEGEERRRVESAAMAALGLGKRKAEGLTTPMQKRARQASALAPPWMLDSDMSIDSDSTGGR